MKYLLFLLTTSILLSSCATVINQEIVPVHVQSNSGPLRFCINKDSSQWYTTPAWITVERSNHQLVITAANDSVEKNIRIPSKISPAFWANLIFPGIYGMVLDLTNNRRFKYPSHILLDLDNPDAYLLPYHGEGNKGLLNMKLSFPDANSFYINNGKKYYSDFGFLGISGGLEYYLTQKRTITATAGGLLNFGFPIPVPLDYDHRYHANTSAAYASLQTGFDIKRFHIDYGAQFTRTLYTIEVARTNPPYLDSIAGYRQNNVGASLSINYKAGNRFSLGLNYYPSVYGWYKRESEWHYSHLLFFEFIFHFQAAYFPEKK